MTEKSRLIEYPYISLPFGFPAISVSVFRALKTGKRGLAVTLWLQESKKYYVVGDISSPTPLTAGKIIDDIISQWGESIKYTSVLDCCECGKSQLPFGSGLGISFYEESESGSFKKFACNNCIKKEEDRIEASTSDIYPPAFNLWPSWAKEAFGPKKQISKDGTKMEMNNMS